MAQPLLLASTRMVPAAALSCGYRFQHAEVDPALGAALQALGVGSDYRTGSDSITIPKPPDSARLPMTISSRESHPIDNPTRPL